MGGGRGLPLGLSSEDPLFAVKRVLDDIVGRATSARLPGGGNEVIWFAVGYAAFSLLFLIWWARGLPPAESLSPSEPLLEEALQEFVPAIPLSGTAKRASDALR